VGYHIGLLIMSALTYLAPEFIKEGRLYWLRSPLWVVSTGKKRSYYFDDDEFNAVRGQIKGEIKRCKGLGTLEPEEAQESMFTDEFQRFEQMEYSPEAIDLLYDLMGTDIVPRRDFIFNNVDFTEVAE
jgi:DNA gyrase subunit B